MAYGEGTFPAGTNEWWGPDLTLPPEGSVEEIAGQHTFTVSKKDWDESLHTVGFVCTPPDMPTDQYNIVNREIVQFIMTSMYEYKITVEWEL